MSEPLTDRELDIMVDCRAAAEIRKLRGDKMRRDITIKSLEAENAKLREALEQYGRHDEENCPVGREHPRFVSEPCTCGLDDILKEADEPAEAKPQAGYVPNTQPPHANTGQEAKQ